MLSTLSETNSKEVVSVTRQSYLCERTHVFKQDLFLVLRIYSRIQVTANIIQERRVRQTHLMITKYSTTMVWSYFPVNESFLRQVIFSFNLTASIQITWIQNMDIQWSTFKIICSKICFGLSYYYFMTWRFPFYLIGFLFQRAKRITTLLGISCLTWCDQEKR